MVGQHLKIVNSNSLHSSLKTTVSLIQVEALLISGGQQPFSEDFLAAVVRKLNEEGKDTFKEIINEYLEIVDTSVYRWEASISCIYLSHHS